MATYTPPQPDTKDYYLPYRAQNPAFRTFMRTPLLLWHMGIDKLVNRWLMVVSTYGRTTGKPRHAVVDYHVIDGKKYAFSGFGPDADWFKNIQHDPHVTIQTKDGIEHVRGRRITDPIELTQTLEAFERENKQMVQALRSMGYEKFTLEAAAAEPDKFYLIAFEPTTEATPEEVKPDMKWAVPALTSVTLSLLVSLTLRRAVRKVLRRH